MKTLYGLLLLLVGCEQRIAEHRQAGCQMTLRPATVQIADSSKSAVQHTSGDRVVNGPNDTLHAGNLVLRLMPGSKSDFANLPSGQLPFSEARIIRQKGNSRVRRLGHTLVVRPYRSPVLRFSDNTHQMRRDNDEETGTQCLFAGSLPGRPYWLIDSLQWERYQPFLVNKYSGRATLLSWDPEISPDRRLLFVAVPGLDIESSLNGLELLAISDQEVKPLWAKTLRNWQPQQAHWLDNHTIAIEQLRFEPTEKTSYIRLVLP